MFQAFLTQKLVGMVSRHAMSAAGVYLVAEGHTDEETWQQIMGGGLAGVAMIFSMAEKFLSRKPDNKPAH